MASNDRKEWISRMVSTVHAAWQVIGGVVILSQMQRFDLLEYNGFGDFHFVGAVSYFLYDTVLCLSTRQLRDPGVVLHHVLGIVAYSTVVATRSACTLVAFLLVSEASTPFVNFRWFFTRSGMRDDPIFTANGVLLALTFVSSRILPFPLLCWFICESCGFIYYFWHAFSLTHTFRIRSTHRSSDCPPRLAIVCRLRHNVFARISAQLFVVSCDCSWTRQTLFRRRCEKTRVIL